MAPGDIHFKYYKRGWIGIVIWGIIITILLATFIDADLVIVHAVSLLFNYYRGRWIDPDLDQISVSSSEGRMMRELGLFGVLLSAYWLPYAWLVGFFARLFKVSLPISGGHRSIISHSIVPGTLLRILWDWLPLIVVICVYPTNNAVQYILPYVPVWLLGQFEAFAFGDLIHLRLDKDPKYATSNRTPTNGKRTTQRYKRGRRAVHRRRDY